MVLGTAFYAQVAYCIHKALVQLQQGKRHRDNRKRHGTGIQIRQGVHTTMQPCNSAAVHSRHRAAIQARGSAAYGWLTWGVQTRRGRFRVRGFSSSLLLLSPIPPARESKGEGTGDRHVRLLGKGERKATPRQHPARYPTPPLPHTDQGAK